MANTPPPPPIRERPTEWLVQDCCLELRHVACSDYGMLEKKDAVKHVLEVQAIHEELCKRRIDLQPYLSDLSEQTKWDMHTLFAECLKYPDAIPLVREADGIRRVLRCRLCGQSERPVDGKVLWFCNRCMEITAEMIRERQPRRGLTLIRTYNPEARCEHANNDTVLVIVIDDYDVPFPAICEVCIQHELQRRRGS